MQYPLFIGLIVGLVMVCLAPNPFWWAVALVGMIANGLVVAVNGWKMPVSGATQESIRHTPMTAKTRLKWLGDIVPTGFGKASLGDFFLAAGVCGGWATRGPFTYLKMTALLCFWWWSSGWAKGFVLLEKWPAEVRRDCRKNIPIVLVLMLIGNFLNVHGCSVGELRASVKDVKEQIAPKVEPTKIKPAKWRNLGKLAEPPARFLTRLREETAKQEREARKQEWKQLQAKLADVDQYRLQFMTTVVTQKAARRGPFCRVTCAAHHGGMYDVETLPDLCRANAIPKEALWVPGWYAISKESEIAKPWPGPADQGFEHYKLYWSELQSEAKVVHQSSQQQ